MKIEAPAKVRRQMQRMGAVTDRIDAATTAKRNERAALWSTNKPHGRKPLPPYGRQWIEAGRRYGPFVFCGPGAWDLAARRTHCGFALVAPIDRDPLDLDWSLLAGRVTILIEAGGFDTELVERTALALLIDGAPHVRTIRRVHPDQRPPICGSYARDDYAE